MTENGQENSLIEVTNIIFRSVCACDVPRDGAVPAQRYCPAVRCRLALWRQARLLQPHAQGTRQMRGIHEKVSAC